MDIIGVYDHKPSIAELEDAIDMCQPLMLLPDGTVQEGSPAPDPPEPPDAWWAHLMWEG